ncbi:PREDICTED: la-related protein 6C [Brassica oleracea var. oleracea]|uniref:HTH La-type RNA-binding domain-containing protein n=1 Tax=Brassica oleracea var. oleracea TaxID=109376 RepID=A0A0D3CIL2_BRAOL|nr:PREDICTED: la-related protein 6C [Brassica oleracea var. oleracea]
MAQMHREDVESVTADKKVSDGGGGGGGGGSSGTQASSFKFNAEAPEFVPQSRAAVPTPQVSPISGYFYPCFHYSDGGGTAVGSQASDWFFVGGGDPAQHPHVHDPAAAFYVPSPAVQFPVNQNSSPSSSLLSDDLRLKIVKQVEYQFTDMSLLANESISKHMNKDPEGYVPISYIASTKKIKALTSNHHLVSLALRSSSKLVVSEDNKKVKRKVPFTDRDREDLQGRTVVAENLPDDHSYQNLEKIFGVVGNVKAIRICHPPESNSSRPKGDFLMSNKIHALIEYDHTVVADKAVEKLNDERNWRKGLRVRLLLRCSPKSVLKHRRNFDGILIDDESPYESGEDSPRLHLTEHQLDNEGDENTLGGLWGKGRGKGRGRSPRSYVVGGGERSFGIGMGLSLGPMSPSLGLHGSSSPKTATKGPRMPDGTRGFTMGRGKPVNLSLI